MLEEIRVKMMTRIINLREFPSTLKCNFSPIALKVLEENISRSIDYIIEFNGAVGFEMKEGLCQHKVDIARRTCSYRVWQLRGIPCAHVVAVKGHTMCPVSTNTIIEPPKITNMPSRTSKSRRKEAGEIKKSGKLPRTVLAMICSICHVRGHNKRGCPQREGVESSTRQSAPSIPIASLRAKPTGSGWGRGKPKVIFELVLIFLNL